MPAGYALGGLVVNGPIRKALANLDVRIGEAVMPQVQHSRRGEADATPERKMPAGRESRAKKGGAPRRPLNENEDRSDYFAG